ncbi:MAG: regulatory protein RecX [Bacteroidales bacterium]
MDNDNYQQRLESAKTICARGEKCADDIYKKNRKWQLSDDEINQIIKILKKEGFIDHQRYAKAFANDKLNFNHWGRNKIKYGLINKGIEKQFIDEALENLDENVYAEILKQEIDKKLKSLTNKDNHKNKQRIIQYLLQKGFEYGKVFEFIEKRMEKDND